MCISREEQDSIRALAGTAEETKKLAQTLYSAVMGDPDAKSKSSDKLRAIRVTPIRTPSPMAVPPSLAALARKAGGG